MKAAKLTALLIAAFGVMALSGLMINNSKAFAADPVGCVNTTKASDFSVSWSDATHFTVYTQSGIPECDTMQLHYSTYAMPDNYDGLGFFYANSAQLNPTAFPQTLRTNLDITIDAGTSSKDVDYVPTLDGCVNIQDDLYTGQEVYGINAAGYGYDATGAQITSLPGHGDTIVSAGIHQKTLDGCDQAPGMGGGNGDGTTTPTTPTIPTTSTTLTVPANTVTTPTAMVLPDTGAPTMQNMLSTLASFTLSAGLFFTAGLRILRANR